MDFFLFSRHFICRLCDKSCWNDEKSNSMRFKIYKHTHIKYIIILINWFNYKLIILLTSIFTFFFFGEIRNLTTLHWRIFNLEKLFPSLSVYWIEEAGICLHLTVRKSLTSDRISSFYWLSTGFSCFHQQMTLKQLKCGRRMWWTGFINWSNGFSHNCHRKLLIF